MISFFKKQIAKTISGLCATLVITSLFSIPLLAQANMDMTKIINSIPQKGHDFDLSTFQKLHVGEKAQHFIENNLITYSKTEVPHPSASADMFQHKIYYSAKLRHYYILRTGGYFNLYDLYGPIRVSAAVSSKSNKIIINRELKHTFSPL